MQIQTTIIETSQTAALGATFQVTVYEQSISVFCDCCSNQATGTKDALRNQGWSFFNGSEFCPNCND